MMQSVALSESTYYTHDEDFVVVEVNSNAVGAATADPMAGIILTDDDDVDDDDASYDYCDDAFEGTPAILNQNISFDEVQEVAYSLIPPADFDDEVLLDLAMSASFMSKIAEMEDDNDEDESLQAEQDDATMLLLEHRISSGKLTFSSSQPEEALLEARLGGDSVSEEAETATSSAVSQADSGASAVASEKYSRTTTVPVVAQLTASCPAPVRNCSSQVLKATTQEVEDDAASMKNTTSSTSRLTNKKRRKQMKLAKKAAAAAVAATNLAQMATNCSPRNRRASRRAKKQQVAPTSAITQQATYILPPKKQLKGVNNTKLVR